jgi:hypothetical protein
MAEKKDGAIYCGCWWGPVFGDGDSGWSDIAANCNANTRYTSLGNSYANDTALRGNTVFTGSKKFTVKEIEVFEVTKETALAALLACRKSCFSVFCLS